MPSKAVGTPTVRVLQRKRSWKSQTGGLPCPFNPGLSSRLPCPPTTQVHARCGHLLRCVVLVRRTEPQAVQSAHGYSHGHFISRISTSPPPPGNRNRKCLPIGAFSKAKAPSIMRLSAWDGHRCSMMSSYGLRALSGQTRHGVLK